MGLVGGLRTVGEWPMPRPPGGDRDRIEKYVGFAAATPRAAQRA